MPTTKQIEQAICCPKGCLRPEDCWSSSVKKDVVEAVAALWKPKIVQRPPFVIEED